MEIFFFAQLELDILVFPVRQIWLEYNYFFVCCFEFFSTKYKPASGDFLSGSSAGKHVGLFPI